MNSLSMQLKKEANKVYKIEGGVHNDILSSFRTNGNNKYKENTFTFHTQHKTSQSKNLHNIWKCFLFFIFRKLSTMSLHYKFLVINLDTPTLR